MINMEPKHLEILLNILQDVPYTFYMFGSRITDKAKRLSDIDLFYQNIPDHVIIQLEDAFEESDLPYKVDIIDYDSCDKDFQKVMCSKYVVIPNKHSGLEHSTINTSGLI